MARGPLRLSRAGKPPTLAPPGPGSLEYVFRAVRGGKRRVMEMAPLAASFEPRFASVVTLWHQLTPWQQRVISLDELAAHSQLSAGEFLGALTRAAFEHTSDLADLLAASAFPEAVRAGVRRALKPQGWKDRQILFEYIARVSAQRAARKGDSVRKV